MSSIAWPMRAYALFLLLLRTSSVQEVVRNDTIPALLRVTGCHCYGEEGKEINLTPLEGTDGNPRFVHYTSFYILKI